MVYTLSTDLQVRGPREAPRSAMGFSPGPRILIFFGQRPAPSVDLYFFLADPEKNTALSR